MTVYKNCNHAVWHVPRHTLLSSGLSSLVGSVFLRASAASKDSETNEGSNQRDVLHYFSFVYCLATLPCMSNLLATANIYRQEMTMSKNLKALMRLILESERTPVVKRVDMLEERKKKMDTLARMAAKKLGLVDVRFIARSSRFFGAYTYGAVNDDHMNVILKLQPASEIEAYKRIHQMAHRLPHNVAIHLPTIYKVVMLERLLPMVPYELEPDVQDLGVIVMERLEELPGNMFDLITQPVTKSTHSLASLASDREAFASVIDEAMKKSRRAIESTISGAPRQSNPADEFDRLKKMLVSAAYDPMMTAQDDESSTSSIERLRSAIGKKIELWCKALGITRMGSIQSLTQMIVSSITSMLGRRAVPREPTEETPGPLGKVRGIKELVSALDDLKSMNINPSDIHGNNIMIRPETGELVLADLGHFT